MFLKETLSEEHGIDGSGAYTGDIDQLSLFHYNILNMRVNDDIIDNLNVLTFITMKLLVSFQFSIRSDLYVSHFQIKF